AGSIGAQGMRLPDGECPEDDREAAIWRDAGLPPRPSGMKRGAATPCPTAHDNVSFVRSKGGTTMTTDPNQTPRDPQYPPESPQSPETPQYPQTPQPQTPQPQAPQQYGEGAPQEPVYPATDGPYAPPPPPSGVYGAPPPTGPYGTP